MSKLKDAMAEILLQEKAANLLQASQDEENIVVRFASEVIGRDAAHGNKDIEGLYRIVETQRADGGTALFEGLDAALREMSAYDLDAYTPAVILMTDGVANGSMGLSEFQRVYRELGLNIPVFCISFGSADMSALNAIAELTNARVFDGDKDLIAAFRKAKGYN